MDGYVGCTDMPPLDFVQELMDVYPEAKVVLTTRDPDKWLESIRPIARNSSLWWLKYAMFPVPGWRWFNSLSLEFGRSVQDILTDGTTEANPEPSTSEPTCWLSVAMTRGTADHSIRAAFELECKGYCNGAEGETAYYGSERGMGSSLRVLGRPGSERAAPKSKRCAGC